jgi:hypothetical protein
MVLMAVHGIPLTDDDYYTYFRRFVNAFSQSVPWISADGTPIRRSPGRMAGCGLKKRKELRLTHHSFYK